jgi:hypothetical protein
LDGSIIAEIFLGLYGEEEKEEATSKLFSYQKRKVPIN